MARLKPCPSLRPSSHADSKARHILTSQFEMTSGQYGLEPVPFNDGGAVASMNMSTEYEVILLTSEGLTVATCGTIWEQAKEAGAKAQSISTRLRPD
jgi:hypothetical protein